MPVTDDELQICCQQLQEHEDSPIVLTKAYLAELLPHILFSGHDVFHWVRWGVILCHKWLVDNPLQIQAWDIAPPYLWFYHKLTHREWWEAQTAIMSCFDLWHLSAGEGDAATCIFAEACGQHLEGVELGDQLLF